MAALAAKNQGMFWKFHKALLKNYTALNDEKIQSIARNMGLDMDRFNTDKNSPENRAMILEDQKDARRIGVRGTPSVFINGKSVKNNRLGTLSRIIAAELKHLEKASQK